MQVDPIGKSIKREQACLFHYPRDFLKRNDTERARHDLSELIDITFRNRTTFVSW